MRALATALYLGNLALCAQTTLAGLREKSRPLLIFAGTNDAPMKQQLALLADHAAAVADRDVRIVLLAPSPSKMRVFATVPQAVFSNAEERHVRRRFHIAPNEFAVLLIGKDGGEKLRSFTPLPWQRLASTIDAMPMRQDELRQH